MSIEDPEQLAALQAAGRVVAQAIRAMRAAVGVGVTTGQLDEVGAQVFARAGARSGPKLDYGFPGTHCISVNVEAVHGVPGRRRLKQGSREYWYQCLPRRSWSHHQFDSPPRPPRR